MDMSKLILEQSLGAVTFTYVRSLETVNDKGRSEKSQITLTAQGNIQPAPGNERELLEEGERQKAAILIFTTEALIAGEDAVKADRVHFNGGVYKVSLVEPWQHHANFTKAIAVYEQKL